MAEIKVPDKNNPSNFNAGANLKNNSVPTANNHKRMESLSSNDNGELTKNENEDSKKSANNGLQNAKNNLKKEAIATGVQILSDGAIDRNVTKKALDTKLGNKVIEGIQTPTERYQSNKQKIREKRMSEGLEPDYYGLWYDALPVEGKVLLFCGIGLFFGILFFVSIFATIFENNSILKAQSFGYISGKNAGSTIQNILSSESSLSEKFSNIFEHIITKDFDNIGNIFSSSSECKGDECGSRAEVLYFQKIADISYRYKNLYNVELDWPLIIASNLSQSNNKEKTFEENLNEYDDITDLDEVINLDWEYDYKSIEDYIYLDADDSRYDLQLLAKNMVTKTTIQSCVLEGEVLETTTLVDIMDSELTEDSEYYLECLEGEYEIENTYQIDMVKYDEFLSEYIEKKYIIRGSGGSIIESNNGSTTIIAGANSLANAFVLQARNQLTSTDNSIYWKYMGYSSRVPWCAAFVAWVTNNTDYNGQKLYPNIIKTKTASAAGYMRYFIDSSDGNINFRYNTNCSKYGNKGSYTPKPGDLIFFDWQQSWDGNLSGIQIGNGVIDHVGIVEKVEGGKVYTVEGNSSDDVRSRNYSLSSCKVVGYGSWY